MGEFVEERKTVGFQDIETSRGFKQPNSLDLIFRTERPNSLDLTFRIELPFVKMRASP